MPFMSRCSSGPDSARRMPRLHLTTSSMSSALATPFSSREMASRARACWMRLAMKPGISLRTSTGRLPPARSMSMTRATVCSDVSSLRTTSTSGITSAGVKKWVPTKRSRRVTAWAMSLIDRPEVLVAKMACGSHRVSSRAKMSRLSASFSGTASITSCAEQAASRPASMRMRCMAGAMASGAYTPSCRSMTWAARVSAPSIGSISTTSKPLEANRAAMPLPMAPAPTTARFWMGLSIACSLG
ncbi:Uncharacterised protein [Bordetella pertussis]|nr:Uncharacterised protein [Bordetella pertussis]CFP61521.1 Uncharacterised protein [Bordetella pertussis]CFW36104.1 Uncharacterised protein [Bordetella pertussis]